MRYFGDRGPENPALHVQHDFETRQAIFDEAYDGLAAYHLPVPTLETHQLENGHTLTLVNATGAGGSYKHYSAAGGVAVLSSRTSEAVTATAGNYGGEFGLANNVSGRASTAFAPHNLSPVKEAAMQRHGVRVVKAGGSVAESLAYAQDYASQRPDRAFVHPYNNPWGIAAMRYLGKHVLDGLRKQHVAGAIDLERTPTDIFVPVGGGSGLAGVASALRSEKDAGDAPDTVQAFGVRPQRLRSGALNGRFDGLAVATPGNNTAPLLESRRFVAGIRLVGEAAVADASRFVSDHDKTHYEANSLVTAAAALQWAADNPYAAPRNFVAILTGQNSQPEQHRYFKELAGYQGSEQHMARLEAQRKAAAASLVQAAFKREVSLPHLEREITGIHEVNANRAVA